MEGAAALGCLIGHSSLRKLLDCVENRFFSCLFFPALFCLCSLTDCPRLGSQGRGGVGLLQGCGSTGVVRLLCTSKDLHLLLHQTIWLLVLPVAGRGDAAIAWWNCAGTQCCRLIPLGQLSCVTCCGDQRLIHVDLRVEQDSPWEWMYLQAYMS